MILGNIENQTLLALLAYALFAQEMNIDATNVNWDQVIAEANRHGRAHRPEAPRNPRRFLRSGAHRIEAVQACDTLHFQYAVLPVRRALNAPHFRYAELPMRRITGVSPSQYRYLRRAICARSATKG